MPVTDEAVTRLVARLSAARAVEWRKMFGGVGLYCDGTFFGVIDDDRLYFKFDEETSGLYDGFGSPQWVIAGDPPQPMPYREVPSSVLADPVQLGEFMLAAVEVARRKKKAKKK